MGVLTEFVKSEAAHLRGELDRRAGERERWQEAILRLNEQLSQWVKDADSNHGLLAVSPTIEFTRQEALLGVYSINGISVTLGGRLNGRSADVIPRARYVAASIKPPGEESRRADGMVEIKGDAGAEYYLFRRAEPSLDQDRWFIQSADEWNSDTGYGRVDPLNRESFEAAILQILQ